MQAGYARVETYIASGNLLLDASASAAKVKADLERRLLDLAGKPIRIALRTAAEMKAVIAANPFPTAAGNFTIAIFLDAPPAADAARYATGSTNEKIRIGRREIYVHYPQGQDRSKLRLSAAKDGTARTMNTGSKMAEMSSR